VRIGAYDVLKEIGRGGAGVVFRARGPLGEDVAVKVLQKLDAETLKRFERERRLFAGLGLSEGFVPTVESGDQDGHPFLVMPLVTGGTLRDKLVRGPLGVAGTIALGDALAAALAVAHERGVVHRDLKPENVLFTEQGQPLVADFGMAKHFGPEQSAALSRSGVFRGTFGYAPPEQLKDAKSVGPGADVFALGAILYECLAGEPRSWRRTSTSSSSR
jgi:serine/threonine-protein kinase